MKISVIGLGKLGLCIAACFASKKHTVLGYDKNKEVISQVSNNLLPVNEPGLKQLLKKARSNFHIMNSVADCVLNSNITLIIVPTPSDPKGRFTNKYIEDVLRKISPILKNKKTFYVIDIISTIMPASCDLVFKPLLEKLTGKVCGRDFGLVYNPAFIALGSAIRDFLNPDLVLIGASDRLSAALIRKLFKTTCNSVPSYAVMSLVNSEITKLSINCYITMKISFANELATICSKVPGADVDIITNALGADSRIGRKSLKGGLGFGGPCFPRDNRAFSAFAKSYGIKTELAKATIKVNISQIKNLTNLVLKSIPKTNGSISVIGLSYKPKTPVIDESPAVKLIYELLKRNMRVIVYDALAIDNIKACFGDIIHYATSVKNCFVQSSVCIITTPDNEFKIINENYIVHNPTTIIDCWRIIDPSKLGNKVKYIPFGKLSTY